MDKHKITSILFLLCALFIALFLSGIPLLVNDNVAMMPSIEGGAEGFDISALQMDKI